MVRRVLSWAALVAFVCGSLAPARATDGCPAGYITAPTSLVTLYFSAYVRDPDGLRVEFVSGSH